MKVQVFHSVDSSLYFTYKNTNILIDGIHNGPEVGFSPMPEVLADDLQQSQGIFAHVDNILFTHLHDDHYDGEKLSAYLEEHSPTIYGPELSVSNADVFPVCSRLDAVAMDQVYLLSLHSTHDGSQFKEVSHRSYLIQLGDENIFVAGDAILYKQDAALLSGLTSHKTSAAFMNLYQIASPSSHEFLRKLQPERVFLYHLPFKKDDLYAIYTLAKSAVRMYPNDLPLLEILPHMQWIDNRKPSWLSCRPQFASK